MKLHIGDTAIDINTAIGAIEENIFDLQKEFDELMCDDLSGRATIESIIKNQAEVLGWLTSQISQG